MHSPPDFQPAPLDLQHVMAAGGRVRRRRRFAVAGASALTVAALLVGGSQLANLRGPMNATPVAGPATPATGPTAQPQPSTGTSSAPGMVNPSAPGIVNPSTPLYPSTGISSAPGVVGTIVETGQKAGGRRWVFYTETSNPHDLNKSLNLILGSTVTGTIDDFDKKIESSEPGTDRMAPGFHSVQAGSLLDGHTTPTFGYYVGNATRITARDTATGKTVEATRAPWSSFGGKPEAQIFWFAFTEGQPPATLTDIAAYDKKGARLH